MAYEYTRTNDLYDDVAYLLEYPIEVDENGVAHNLEPLRDEVYVKVGAIYEKEFYDALQAGIKAQYKLVVFVGDYRGQKVVEYRDQLYSVYRRFLTGDTIELYLREDVGTWE